MSSSPEDRNSTSVHNFPKYLVKNAKLLQRAAGTTLSCYMSVTDPRRRVSRMVGWRLVDAGCLLRSILSLLASWFNCSCNSLAKSESRRSCSVSSHSIAAYRGISSPARVGGLSSFLTANSSTQVFCRFFCGDVVPGVTARFAARGWRSATKYNKDFRLQLYINIF